MSRTLHFNPLTMAQLDVSTAGSALVLRSFAPGRSLLKTVVVQAEAPGLFAWLTAWLDGNEPADQPALTREQHVQLWTNGLIVSEAERDAMPPQARCGWSVETSVVALCPAAGSLLSAPLRLHGPPADAGQALREDGLTVLPCLFEAQDLAAIRAWYQLLADGNWLKPDGHQTRQKIIHNDPVARYVQAALVPTVSDLAGELLKPSFAYATEYHQQANLPRHTDRAQCEYTLSIYVDYLPEPESEQCPWPLLIHAASGDREFRQNRGGGLLFRGRQLEHSRPHLPQGDRALLFFLCYVAEGFVGSLD